MKKAIVIVLSVLILCVMAAMGMVMMKEMEPAQAPAAPQPTAQAQAPVWQDGQGRCSVEIMEGWDVMNIQEAQAVFGIAQESGKASIREQVDLMQRWMNTGESVLLISPDRRSSIIVSCQTMNTVLTDEYVSNIRSRYAREAESAARHIQAGEETDEVLPQTGNRIAGVNCLNTHPSAWLLDLDQAGSHVYFTWKGPHLYTFVISDTDPAHGESVRTRLFETLVLN